MPTPKKEAPKDRYWTISGKRPPAGTLDTIRNLITSGELLTLVDNDSGEVVGWLKEEPSNSILADLNIVNAPIEDEDEAIRAILREGSAPDSNPELG